MYNKVTFKHKGNFMTNVSIAEKRALEEVFICLEERKKKKVEYLKSCLQFYKKIRLKRKFAITLVR